jgi:fatty acid desaturase
MFRDTHMLHHRQTFSEQDVEAQSVRNWSLLNVVEYAFIDVRALVRRVFYVTINALGFYLNFSPLCANYVRSARITLLFNMILYVSLYYISRDLLVTFLMAVAPFSCSLLNKIFAKAQHHDLINFKNEGSLRYSRTLVLPKFLSFLYANMNYHAEHHFAPSVPYYNLPKMHKLLKTKRLISSQSFFSFFNEEFQTVWLKR